MIEEHKNARENNRITVQHEFKLRYKKNSNIIYGFVEGKEDPSFYRGFLENNLPEKWSVELWPSGGKDNVLEIYSKFDWRSFDKTQILFFIDKDLSEYTQENLPEETNIYVTDNYSIENGIVNSNTCDRVLREVCGFSFLKYDDAEKIHIVFIEQLEFFQKSLITIMSDIIVWRKENRKACLNDIYMKHLFKIKNGIISPIEKPKNHINVSNYIHKQCNLETDNLEKSKNIAKQFKDNKDYLRLIRGKYLFWYLIEFCLSIYKDYKTLPFVDIVNKPKMVVNLSQSNGIVQIAPRSRIPNSLRYFFSQTIEKYIIGLKKVA